MIAVDSQRMPQNQSLRSSFLRRELELPVHKDKYYAATRHNNRIKRRPSEFWDSGIKNSFKENASSSLNGISKKNAKMSQNSNRISSPVHDESLTSQPSTVLTTSVTSPPSVQVQNTSQVTRTTPIGNPSVRQTAPVARPANQPVETDEKISFTQSYRRKLESRRKKKNLNVFSTQETALEVAKLVERLMELRQDLHKTIIAISSHHKLEGNLNTELIDRRAGIKAEIRLIQDKYLALTKEPLVAPSQSVILPRNTSP